MSAPIFTPDRQAFREAVAAIAEKARATLPACNGRIEKAVALVLQGDVELLPDGTARIFSQSNGVTSYHLVNGVCDCHDYERAPSHWCKHRIAHGIQKRAQALVPAPAPAVPEDREPWPEEAPGHDPAPAPVSEAPASVAVSGVDPRYVVLIQGKPFTTFAGLLALAHQRGLQELRVVWTYNDAELSLASATATFPFGTFQEAGDASPSNVTRKVSPHFRRVACTRAAARALRLALGIDVCAIEELADE